MKRYQLYLTLLFACFGAAVLSNENQLISGKFILFALCVFMIFLVYFLNEHGLLTFDLRAYRCLSKGNSSYMKNRCKEALGHYSEAIERGPRFAAAYVGKSGALICLKRYGEALEASEKALGLMPRLEMAHVGKCTSMLMLGRIEEAFELTENAIKLKVKSPYLFNIKGLVYTILQKHEDALKEYGNAIKLKWNSPLLYSNEGYSLTCLGRFDEAVKTLENALSLDKGLRAARQNLAFALKMRNKEDDSFKAAEILEGLTQDDPRDLISACTYALLNERQKLLELAKELSVNEPIFNWMFFSGLEFEPYRKDPDFLAAVKKQPSISF